MSGIKENFSKVRVYKPEPSIIEDTQPEAAESKTKGFEFFPAVGALLATYLVSLVMGGKNVANEVKSFGEDIDTEGLRSIIQNAKKIELKVVNCSESEGRDDPSTDVYEFSIYNNNESIVKLEILPGALEKNILPETLKKLIFDNPAVPQSNKDYLEKITRGRK